MTIKQSEQPDMVDAWAHTQPDPHSLLELDEARSDGDKSFDALVSLVNAGLEACSDKQATIWRLHTGIRADGTVVEPLSTKRIAAMLEQTHNTIRGAFNEAQVRVLSRIMTQQMPRDMREAALGMIGGRIVGGPKALEQQPTQIALDLDAPEYQRGRLDQVATDNARVDINVVRPELRASKGEHTGAHGVRFGPWERQLPRGPLRTQGKEWETFHQRQLERIDRQRKAAEGE